MSEVLDWVHPSVRDVVIEHLTVSHDDRIRFLSTTDVSGIALALSIAGGVSGERTQPLLQNEEDWSILLGRVVELVATGRVDSHVALMRQVNVAHGEASAGRGDLEKVTALAVLLLQEVATDWSRRAAVNPSTTWRIYYSLQIQCNAWVGACDPLPTWKAVLDGVRRMDVDDLAPLVELARLVQVFEEYEPRFLMSVGYTRTVAECLTCVSGEIRSRFEALPVLDRDEDQTVEISEGVTAEIPVEPGSEEDWDTDWLDALDDFNRAFARWVGDISIDLPDAEDVQEALATRQTRKERWEEFRPDYDGDSDYRPGDSAGESSAFSVMALFSDL